MATINIKQLILGHSLPARFLCPFCNSKESTLAVFRIGSKIGYRCHRACCNASGAFYERGEYVDTTSEEKPVVALSVPSEGLYSRREVLDEDGNSRGAVYRRKSTTPRHLPKDINRIDKDWIGLHFPAPLSGKTVIVVEDIISANRMSKYFPCVALLGVHLNENKVSYLCRLGISHIIIALDNDATRQAIKLARRFVIQTSVLPLQRDFKDETEETLIEIAEGLRCD